MRLLAVLVAAALLGAALAPGPALAAPRLIDAGPVGATVRGDGPRYLASASIAADLTSSPVIILDVSTGAERVAPTPSGCYFADIHHATLLWSCAQRPAPYAFTAYGAGITYNLATGRLTLLAPPHPGPPIGMPDAGSYQQIGDRWARLGFEGYHYAFSAYVDLMTGTTLLPNPTRGQIVDPDRVPLVRRLCAGQRRPYVPDDVSPVGGVTLGDLATAGRWAAGTTYAADSAPGRVEFQRCGAKPRTLRVCRQPVFCSQPLIGAHLVAWVEDRGPRHKLVVRSLRALRGRAVRIGRVASFSFASSIQPLLVGDRLYLAASGRLLRVAL